MLSNVGLLEKHMERLGFCTTAGGEYDLDTSQRRALDTILEGNNVFITGPAGSGKSMLLTKAIKALEEQGMQVAVLAPTGIAAVHVGGTTVHSWSGCGVPSLTRDFRKMWGRKDVIRETDVIVLDEVSMMSGELLDRIEEMVSNIRNNEDGMYMPFGGIQLILCGDFLQLPPVSEEPELIDVIEHAYDDVFLNRGW
jgi:ATP-dependent DNA helicase PIF1